MLRLPTCSALVAFTLALTACGGGGGNSAPAPAPVQAAAIATQPASATVAAGQAVTFTVTASGSAPSYQWQRDGKDIAGATAASYTLSNVQPGDDGASFTVVVRNSAGSVTSAAAVLKVGAAKGLSLLAGGLGGPGNLDGTDARFMGTGMIALGPAGILYVAENVNGFNALRTVDIATGAVATVRVQPLPALDTLIAMVFDSAGNRYELSRTAVYKTTPEGTRSLLAGSFQSGYVDGAGENARFSQAAGMAIDSTGNLYVIDAGSHTLRKVTPAGMVTTLAGVPGSYEALDGKGSEAHFGNPTRVAVDRAGSLWVLDLGIVRKVSAAGEVTTPRLQYAGQPGPVSSSLIFDSAAGFAADTAGNLYVTDSHHGCLVHRIAADGTVSDFAGKPDTFGSADGQGDSARFCAGYGSGLGNLVFDSAGNLYVGDPGNRTIRRITPAGEVSTVAGRAAHVDNVDGPGPAARFGLATVLIPPPRGFYEPAYELTADAQGNVYVGESDRIRKVTGTGAVTTLPGATDAAAGTVYYGSGLAFDGSRLAVSNGVIYRVDANGAAHFLAGKAGGSRTPVDGAGANATFFQPNKLIADGLGRVYLKDVEYHNPATEAQGPRTLERRIAPDGSVTTLPEGVYAGSAWYADKVGNVWVAKFDRSVVRIAPDGQATVVRSAPGGNGVPASAMTADRNGNVYLAEGTTVRRITPAGAESVVAGNPAWSGVRLGAQGTLGPVDALAAGDDGTVYVMSENAVLRLSL